MKRGLRANDFATTTGRVDYYRVSLVAPGAHTLWFALKGFIIVADRSSTGVGKFHLCFVLASLWLYFSPLSACKAAAAVMFDCLR